MDFRIEHDSMGEVCVPSDKCWGAQTQRSLENFKIGEEKMPLKLVYALSYIKEACALANSILREEKMTGEKLEAISFACRKIRDGELDSSFPLSVWQTGSGTQTNMNLNEVIARIGNEYSNKNLLHPNDDVNMSQSSNDVFPSAMHVSVALAIEKGLLPSLKSLIKTFKGLSRKYMNTLKIGRTHLQDATPISFGQEISGWYSSLERDYEMIECASSYVKELALGGTAVGTGLNCPCEFDKVAISKLCELTGLKFRRSKNKFHALTSKSELVLMHGALKALACDLTKIANDVRWLASGPRCGLGEITIPENEPGSSIMPGKVNPTQCEAMTMVCAQVIGNDTTISIGASNGNFELNVYMPVIAYNVLQSITLLSDAICSFNKGCASGIVANEKKMRQNLEGSLMLVTALTPYIGYEKGAEIARLAHKKGISLKEASIKLGYLTSEEFDSYIKPERMI